MANSTMAGRKEVKRMKKILSVVLACILSISCCTVNGQAIYADTEPPAVGVLVTHASGSFNMTVPANSIVRDRTALTMSKGEVVQITATYSPSGRVDFGLVDSDGVFHYVNATNGSIDKSIEITESGENSLLRYDPMLTTCIICTGSLIRKEGLVINKNEITTCPSNSQKLHSKFVRGTYAYCPNCTDYYIWIKKDSYGVICTAGLHNSETKK